MHSNTNDIHIHLHLHYDQQPNISLQSPPLPQQQSRISEQNYGGGSEQYRTSFYTSPSPQYYQQPLQTRRTTTQQQQTPSIIDMVNLLFPSQNSTRRGTTSTTTTTTSTTPPTTETTVHSGGEGVATIDSSLRNLTSRILNRMSENIDDQHTSSVIPAVTTTTSSDGGGVMDMLQFIFRFEPQGGDTTSSDDVLPPTLNDISKNTDYVVYDSLPTSEKMENKECVICKLNYEPNDVLRKLHVCNHSFHVRCVDKWFEKSRFCPLCRADITMVSSASSNTTVASSERQTEQRPASSHGLRTSGLTGTTPSSSNYSLYFSGNNNVIVEDLMDDDVD